MSGTFPLGRKIHFAKSWSGGDGKTNSITGETQWNGYLMASQVFKSSNPNRIGLIEPVNNTYVEHLNHSFGKTSGPPESIGYAAFGNGSISHTWPTSQFNSIWTGSEELALLAKLINKVRGHSFDMGVALAEVDKLAGTVLGTVNNLIGGIGDLKKLRFKKFARRFGAKPPSKNKTRRLTTRDISGRFLEMRYAWEPAIADVWEAAKAFENISNGPRKVRFKASRRVRRQTYYNSNYCRVDQVIDVKRSYLVEMTEEIGFNAQLGLSHPGSVLWERLPWSFVIDWFIPIGTYLSVLGVLPKMKARWLRSSSIRWVSAGTFAADPTASGGYQPADPKPDCNWERFQYERTVSSSPPPIPPPTLKVIGAVQGRRISNALALAHQVFSKAQV